LQLKYHQQETKQSSNKCCLDFQAKTWTAVGHRQDQTSRKHDPGEEGGRSCLKKRRKYKNPSMTAVDRKEKISAWCSQIVEVLRGLSLH